MKSRSYSRNNILQDFDDFDISNEDDVLEEFLGLERLKPKVNDG